MNPASSTILPDGVDDRLPPVAFARHRVMARLLQFFYDQGYDFIDPPLVEFASGYIAPTLVNPHNTPSNVSFGTIDGFTTFDMASGRRLVIRPDMTIGVARIAGEKLASRPRPLRLCYGGDILRAQAINGKRQLTQVGIEVIGGKGQDVAILKTLFAALEEIIDTPTDTSPLWCELALPSALRAILNTIPQEQMATVEGYIRHKDMGGLADIRLPGVPSTTTNFLVELLGLSGLAADVAPRLKKHEANDVIGKEVASFNRLVAELMALSAEQAGRGGRPPQLAIDITDLLGFDYKTGFAFTLFDRLGKTTVGRGGHYTAGGEAAAGFSLYLDNLLPMVKPTILADQRRG